MTPKLAAHFGLAASRGAAVQTVIDGSPAANAGLQAGGAEEEYTAIPFRPGGDLIIAVDGTPVESAEDVVRAVTQRLLPGQTARLTILRGEDRMVVDVVLGERPANPPGDR